MIAIKWFIFWATSFILILIESIWVIPNANSSARTKESCVLCGQTNRKKTLNSPSLIKKRFQVVFKFFDKKKKIKMKQLAPNVPQIAPPSVPESFCLFFSEPRPMQTYWTSARVGGRKDFGCVFIVQAIYPGQAKYLLCHQMAKGKALLSMSHAPVRWPPLYIKLLLLHPLRIHFNIGY